MNTFAMILSVVAALVAAGLPIAEATDRLRQNRRERHEVLRNRYLHLLMLVLHTGTREIPRFPLLRRRGAWLLLTETLAGIVAATYGLDTAQLRRIVTVHNLEKKLLRRIRLSRGYRRARHISLLASLPIDTSTTTRLARYSQSRNRAVKFQVLLSRMATQPAMTLRLIEEYEAPLSGCEMAEIMVLLRRGILPIAYEPVLRSPSPNLRRIGMGIVKQFSIEEAAHILRELAAGDPEPELSREALYTLCAMHCPLKGRQIHTGIGRLSVLQRRALMRYMVHESYSPDLLGELFGAAGHSYAEALAQTHKRTLA